ncbi:MAG TPA: hypothetical protein VIN07_02705 [Flavipsychrobacter sp.]
MKIPAIAAFICMSIFLSACGDDEVSGESVPIDSTNVHGVAPAQYQADDPAEKEAYEYEGDHNSDRLRENTISAQDSAAGRHKTQNH